MRLILTLACFLFLGGCATDIAAEKASRFDEGVAAYDAGDFATAYRVWYELARDNDLAAMRNAAQLLRQGKGVAKDSKLAFRLYREAAEKGLVTAMANVGDMYMAGEGVERNPEAAAAWYARASTSGLSLAQYRLADMYLTGNGIPKDEARARALLERAARNGYGPARDKLKAMGITLDENGDVVVPPAPPSAPVPPPATETAATDRKPAFPPGLFDRLIGGGSSEPASAPPAKPKGLSPGDPISTDLVSKMAQPDLTAVYAGVAAYNAGDKKNAMTIWHGAATRGVADAQLRVGLLYEKGEGAPQDVIEAYRWLRHASMQGHPLAINELARVSSRLAPAERAIGESLVREPLSKAKKPD